MIKKKLTGQTVAIIILAILLLLTVVFGGVYAYYSSASNKITGRISMANLKISMNGDSGESGSSQILLTNGLCVPGQSLNDTPLTIKNESNTPIYLMVVYSVNATEDGDPTSNPIDVDLTKPLISIGNDTDWFDHYFKDETGVTDTEFRCLISTRSIEPTQEYVTVIEKDRLSLHAKNVGNDFMAKNVSFSFQAYAISTRSLDSVIDADDSMLRRCQIIASAIFSAYDSNLNI